MSQKPFFQYWPMAAITYLVFSPLSLRAEPFPDSQRNLCDTNSSACTLDALVSIDNLCDVDGDGLNDFWELHYFADLEATSGTDDVDSDGLSANVEYACQTDPGQTDSDSDGLEDLVELEGETSPTNSDTDSDGLLDGIEDSNHDGVWEEDIDYTDPLNPDTDNDGLLDGEEDVNGNGEYDPDLGETKALSSDTDNGGTLDGVEVASGNNPHDPLDDDPDLDTLSNMVEINLGLNRLNPDTDGDGYDDQVEVGPDPANPLDTDNDGTIDAWDDDSDDDGLTDLEERELTLTDPLIMDTDLDGIPDGEEYIWATNWSDLGFDCVNIISDPDSENDRLLDVEEKALGTNPCLDDSDNDGLYDYAEYLMGVDATDIDAGLLDSDGDGLPDALENTSCLNPASNDTDSDGQPDDKEYIYYRESYIQPCDSDSDDDGLPDNENALYGTFSGHACVVLSTITGEGVLDGGVSEGPCEVISGADTDLDGILDGTEKGLVLGDVTAGTDLSIFVADEDPTTQTDPLIRDTDEDGLDDGVEDVNFNGRQDQGETDPNLKDSDNDGMDDLWEVTYSDPLICDTPLSPLDQSDGQQVDGGVELDNDGDGLSNFAEYSLTPTPSNPCSSDSDADGLLDEIEVNSSYTDAGLPTDPTKSDTDSDGLLDGQEDKNKSGSTEADETNPLLADTDGDTLSDGLEAGDDPDAPVDTDDDNIIDALDDDSDNDGISDAIEGDIDTDSDNILDFRDPDSDGDGIPDVIESALGTETDTDNDGIPNRLDTDSDNDGILDGLEDVDGDGVVDDDETNPLSTDTDQDTITDGFEDVNQNGIVDDGETNPRKADSDESGVDDYTERYIHGTDPNDALDDYTADPDGDNLTNEEEMTLGSDGRSADTDGDFIRDDVEVGTDVLSPLDSDNDGQPNCFDLDSDGDTIPDNIEAGDSDLATAPVDTDSDGTPDYLDLDSDGDSILDSIEAGNSASSTFPRDVDGDGDADYIDLDSDNDFILDQDERGGGAACTSDPCDTDSDGDADYIDSDSDNDGLSDALESGDEITSTPVLDSDLDGDANYIDTDSDDDGITDQIEIGLITETIFPRNSDVDGTPDYLDSDSDNDGISDNIEKGPSATPRDTDQDQLPDYRDSDSDGDGLTDIEESGEASQIPFPRDTDTDGTPDYLDLDSDNGGTSDADEAGVDQTDPLNTLDDRSGDPDGDGLSTGDEYDLGTDPLLLDTDGDGASDPSENQAGTDPLDQDSDDDGLMDSEDGLYADSDSDGLLDAHDPDADNDGIFDGTEMGIIAASEAHTYTSDLDITYSIAGTDVAHRVFEADEDSATTTSHTQADTDSDGLSDGAEDPNHNGKLEEGESDPNNSQSTETVVDTDGDGLTDAQENNSGLAFDDADTDDDGLRDGKESNWRVDTDRDGLLNAQDADSDNDGLPDGVEVGLSAPQDANATLLWVRNFWPDEDPTTVSNMLKKDTDGGGLIDGQEDTNLNGKLDANETRNDTGFDDDQPVYVDADADGIDDAVESQWGLDPMDADTDDDGIRDGEEPNWSTDSDRDGLISALDIDSDNDHLFDGIEWGVVDAVPSAESILGTDETAGYFQPDADPLSTTYVLGRDSDADGRLDGVEDTNKNGQKDTDETDATVHNAETELCADVDKDLLCDSEETSLGLDPTDADSDDDGLLDGWEQHALVDTDGDGLINALDKDSDDDGILDGIEYGIATVSADTDSAIGFLGDQNPATFTWMLLSDSDQGGVVDGDEDMNHNGSIELGETDPHNFDDDGTTNSDLDGDGLHNDLERQLGTDFLLADSDGDNISDVDELKVTSDEEPDSYEAIDTDEDGLIDAVDTDSDNDGWSDAEEAGDDDLATPPVDTDTDGVPDFRDTDSDGEGLLDSEEKEAGTDRTLADTDGGGKDDYIEVKEHQTNPLLKEDDGDGWFEDGVSVQGGGCQSIARNPALGCFLLVLLFARRRKRRQKG